MQYVCTILFLLQALQYAAASNFVAPVEMSIDRPPLGTDLIKAQEQQQDQKQLASIKRLVSQALTGSKSKKAKKAQKIHKENSPQQMLHDVVALIDDVYTHPLLHDKKITLSSKATSIRELLAAVAAAADISLIIDADVTGSTQPLKVHNVPLAAALKSILSAHNPRLALIAEHGVWRVMTLTTAYQMYAGKAESARSLLYKEHVVVMQHVQWDAEFKKRVEAIWAGIISPSEKNKTFLVFDDPNRKILFKAHTDHAARFKTIIQELNVKLPQIKIDARVVLADKNFEESLGFNWSGVYNRSASVKHFDFVGLGSTSKSTGNGSTATTQFNDIVGWGLNFIPAAVKSAISIPFVFGNSDMNTKRLSIQLAAAENRSEIKTILKPSLLVHNNQQAEILVGQSLPLETRVDEAIEGKLTNLTTVNYKDTGMRLKVKPVITPDHERIFLEMFIENSTIAPLAQADQLGSDSSKFNYTINTAKTTNKVMLRSGETTMIAGLITNVDESSESGVPVLNKIPVLGRLFSWRGKTKAEKQVLIFITPTLIAT